MHHKRYKSPLAEPTMEGRVAYRSLFLILILVSSFAKASADPAWAKGQYICATASDRGSKIQIIQITESGDSLNQTLSTSLPEYTDSNLAISAFLNKYCVPKTVVVNGAWCCIKQ